MSYNYYSVRYYDGSDSVKYVGSLIDYIDGGTADPVLLSLTDAINLLHQLNTYVMTVECAEFRTDAISVRKLTAYINRSWGFQIEPITIP